MHAAGIVLCGGLSKRMGRAKASLPFGNQTMLARVVERVGQAVTPVVIVCAVDQELPQIPGSVQVIRDEIPEQGPLGGLAAGLASLEGSFDAVVLASCDLPFLSPAVIERLLQLIGNEQICIPHVAGRFHPLSAVYKLETVSTVKSQLAQGRLRLLDLIEKLPTRVVSEAELGDLDPGLKSFRNMNTPAEYAEALRLAGFA